MRSSHSTVKSPLPPLTAGDSSTTFAIQPVWPASRSHMWRRGSRTRARPRARDPAPGWEAGCSAQAWGRTQKIQQKCDRGTQLASCSSQGQVGDGRRSSRLGSLLQSHSQAVSSPFLEGSSYNWLSPGWGSAGRRSVPTPDPLLIPLRATARPLLQSRCWPTGLWGAHRREFSWNSAEDRNPPGFPITADLARN